MARLSQSDLRALLDVVCRVESFDDLDAFRSGTLSVLQQLIPHDGAAVSYRHPARSEWDWCIDPNSDAAAFDADAFARNAHEHPLLNYYDDHPRERGRALRLSDFVSQVKLHRLAVYDEFLASIEAEYQLLTAVLAPGPLVIGMPVNRALRDFTERDRALLDLLRPHLAQAYRNLEARTRLRQALVALEHGDEHAERAVVLLRTDGGVALASGSATYWFATYFGDDGDRLPELLEAWIRQARARLSGRHEAPPPATPLVRERPGRRLTVRFLPATVAGELDALVLEERRAGVTSAELAALGLSPRESEVLALVAAGQTNAQIALALGIRPLTVVKHLEHIFDKLGVPTRTAAAAKAFEAVGYRSAAGAA